MFVKCYSMIKIKTKEQIEIMYESAQVVSRTLGMLAREIKPGVTTLYLDKLAEEYIRSQDAKPGFLGLYGFPNTLCVSPNAQVVHGIPNNKPLQEGDIISVDCGALKNGYYGDHAYTFAVGEVSPEVAQLLKVTKESLYIGIREFRLGNRVEDVGYAIQTYCEKHGYGVVRELVGHGVGTKMHEDPEMPNYGRRGRGKKFVEGMVVAIRGRRDQVFLVSKAYPHHAGRKSAPMACERSLERLGVECIDLYLLHWRGGIPLAETVEAFEKLKAQGKIRRWGVSNLDLADMRELYAIPEGKAAAVDQVLYNLTRRGIEWNLLPWLQSQKTALMAYSPIEQGRLLRHTAFCRLAEQHGWRPAQLALAWVLRHEGVIAIPKASRREHVEENFSALQCPLSPEILAQIDRLLPPPKAATPLEML